VDGDLLRMSQTQPVYDREQNKTTKAS
jgi:hypothetical protein